MQLFQMIIVDDEPMIRSGLVKSINWEELGFEVVGAFGSGAEAIEFLASAQVEVVFTDVVMKNGTGIDIAEWISAHKPGIQVVLLTGYSDFETARKAVACKVIRYMLTKPTDITELKAVFTQVHEVLLQRRNSMALSSVAVYLNSDCADIQLPAITLSDGMHITGTISGSIGKRVAIWCCPADKAAELAQAIEELHGINPLLKNGRICRFDTLPAMLQTLSGTQIDSTQQGLWNEQILNQQIQSAFDEGEYRRLDELFAKIRMLDAPKHVVLFAAYVIDLNYYIYCAKEKIQEERDIRVHLIAVMEGKEPVEQLIRCVHALVESCERNFSRNSDHLLSFVDRYLESHLSEGASLAEIAQQMHYSPGYLGRLFKERAGKSFTDYEIEFKIRKAAAMLEDTTLHVKEIGQRIGYSDAQHFSETFRNIMGISPAGYRKSLREQ